MRQLGPVLDFLRALWALDHALQSASKRMETTLGVTGPQRFVIRMIGRFPGISAGEVSELLHVHPSTLTGVLKRLEQRGLVVRRSDPGDARRALLDLTAKGRRVDANRSGTVEGAARKALEKLPPAAMRQTRVLAEAITAELDRLGE
jgi:DNA-binding MarR family transcriptional regulator